MVGTGIGWAIGWRLSFNAPVEWSTLSIGLVTGFFTGIGQWLVLRSHIRAAGWWPLASALGWGLGFFAGTQIAYLSGFVDALFGAMTGATVGATTGIFQLFVLAREKKATGWWILANLLAWPAALLAYRGGVIALGLLYGGLAGSLTGVALLWVLRKQM